MPEIFQPRKLPRNREYPGYQFYCTLQQKDGNAETCFCFAVLSVIDWLKQRLQDTDVIPPEIASLPERQKSREITSGDLKSFTINSGFSAYAVSLPEHGIWALRLKEPDSDTQQRRAVPGRFFATNIGIHILNSRDVELGIRIDVTDPEEALEVDFAFRPKIVRYLYEDPGVTLRQAAELPYEKAVAVENDEQFKILRTILDSSEGTLPLILVTQGIRLTKEDPMPLAGRTAFPSALAAPPAGLFPSAMPVAPLLEKYYPFDADEIAAHNFGYAITCRIPEKMHDPLKSRLKKDYTPGDILFVEPKRFGGNIRICGKDEKDAVNQVWQRAHCYSKDRKYSFGDVPFEFDARNIENREMIEQIRASSDLAAAEKLAQLNRKIDELQTENEKRVRKISELKDQAQIEYDKGVEAERKNNLELIEDHDRLEKELQAASARILQLEQENRIARAQRTALETVRAMDRMPESNEDVIRYFVKVFGDRIGFTDRAVKTGCKCDVKAEGLWYYLYHMAVSLYDIHHAGSLEPEKEFYHATGIEMAPGEKSQKSHDDKAMRTRCDIYEGKDIYAAPHVKLDSRWSNGCNKRIYYCYDRELDKVIVSWIGDHL